MRVLCLYLCNVTRLVVKYKQTLEMLGCVNLLGDKGRNLKGHIGDCRGHDCLTLIFNFKGFHENYFQRIFFTDKKIKNGLLFFTSSRT